MKKKYLFILFIVFTAFHGSVLQSFATTTSVTPDTSQNGLILQSDDSVAGADIPIGRSGASDYDVGVKYIPSASHFICQVDFYIKKNNTPTDNIVLRVYSGGTNPNNGTLIYTSANVWLGSGFKTTSQTASFWFGTIAPPGNCIGVVKNDVYFFTLHRSGSGDSTNYLIFKANSTPSNPSTDTNLVWGDHNGQTCTGGNCSTGTLYGSTHFYGILDGSSLDSTASASLGTFCSGLGLLSSTCTLFSSLFIPNSTFATTSFNTLKDTLNSKAPFGYINAVLALDLSTTGSASTSPTLTLPIGHTNTYVSSALPTSMSWSDSSANSNAFVATSAFRNIFTLLLWVAFVFYIFVALRRIF